MQISIEQENGSRFIYVNTNNFDIVLGDKCMSLSRIHKWSLVPIFLAGLALLPPATASVDTSEWKCNKCPIEYGWTSDFTLGVGGNTQSSYKLGEYTGLHQSGLFSVVDGSGSYKTESGYRFNIDFANLGLDSRSMQIQSGKQGLYQIGLEYDQIPHYISDSASSIFGGTNSSTLTLPSGWVAAGSTSGFAQLGESLQGIPLNTKREKVALNASLLTKSKWKNEIAFHRETKKGLKSTAGSILLHSAHLIEPVDYLHDSIALSTNYIEKRWQLKFAYHGSLYRNNHASLSWQNPFTPVINGADTGELALPPKNQSHIVSANSHHLFLNSHLNLDMSYGVNNQDEPFLLYSNNAQLALSSLPRNSLASRVDTLRGSVKLFSPIGDSFRFKASLRFSDQNNKTPRSDYVWVTTDSVVNPTRTNTPYSFTRGLLSVSGDYQLFDRTHFLLGLKHRRIDRTFQSVDKTNESIIWSELNSRRFSLFDVRLKYAMHFRDGSLYQNPLELTAPENPLLRKFNLADRNRKILHVSGNIYPHDIINMTLSWEYAHDDYSNSIIGLTESTDHTIGAEVSFMLSDTASLFVFYQREDLDSRQAGSQSFVSNDYLYDLEDSIDTGGVGVNFTTLKDKAEIGIDLSATQSVGRAVVDTGAVLSDLPELKINLYSLHSHLDVKLKKNLNIQFSHRYEHYRSDDWALDDVSASTIANVLTLGETTPNYNAHIATIALSYLF